MASYNSGNKQTPQSTSLRKREQKDVFLPATLESLGGKVPPHSLEAEIAVLGSMMLDRAAIPKVIEILQPDSFYRESHKLIYDAILGLFERNINSDYTTLPEELRRREF